MRLRLRTLFTLALILLPLACFGQGLQFKGNDKLIGERTSFAVFDQKYPIFENEFSIDFDLSIFKFSSFGYIFRLKDANTQHFYNLTYSYKDNEKSFLKFNEESIQNLATIEMENKNLGHTHWIHVSIHFSLATDSLTLIVDKKQHHVGHLSLPNQIHLNLSFGKSGNVVDVIPFAIRNLVIKGVNSEYRFPLNENEGEKVHDSKGRVLGFVSNPLWLINKNYYWKKRFVYYSKTVSGLNFDEAAQKILFFNRDSITYTDLSTDTSEVRKYPTQLPVNIKLGTNFLDKKTRKLYVYEVNNLPINDNTIASLDLETNQWAEVSKQALSMQLHHHSSYYDSSNKKYLIFGGFGNQKFSNSFVSYNIEKDKYDTLSLSGDKITPRQFSSMGYGSDQNIYVFGGKGNESGDQTIGHKYFYDLYRINLKSNTIKKLWSIHWAEKNVIPVQNMVMLGDSSFYTLCYAEYNPHSYLRLYKFEVKDGRHEILGDSIPIRSEQIYTNAKLFYNVRLNEFYATVQEFQKDMSSVSSVYSLSGSPINLYNLNVYNKPNKPIFIWFWVALVLFVAITSFSIYKRNKKKFELSLKQGGLSKKYNLAHDKSNAIYLFGDFTVYDKNKKDITYMLSSRLRQVFLLILEYSFEDGISSQQMTESLWPDRFEYNIKNLRGVTLNHLRKVLAELNGINLVFSKGYYKLVIENDCYCDFQHFLELIHANDKINKRSEIHKILERGAFLKGLSHPLYDSFKDKISALYKDIPRNEE